MMRTMRFESLHLLTPIAALALLFCLVLPARGEGASVSFFYTANSLGEYKACPDCGKGALGGLDRRAGFFRSSRAAEPGAVFVSGGWDFLPYSKRRAVKTEVLGALAEAYSRLGYDVGLAVPAEEKALAHAGAVLPPAFRTAVGRPWTRVLERGGLKIGFVGIPAKEDAYAQAGEDLRGEAADAARALRPGVDVLVGLCSWGERDELEFLKEYPGVFDVLFGSGPGTGYGVRVVEGRTVWVRPTFEGRGVMRLDVTSLPPEGGRWVEGRDFVYSAVELDMHVRGDAAVANLFAWF